MSICHPFLDTIFNFKGARKDVPLKIIYCRDMTFRLNDSFYYIESILRDESFVWSYNSISIFTASRLNGLFDVPFEWFIIVDFDL